MWVLIRFAVSGILLAAAAPAAGQQAVLDPTAPLAHADTFTFQMNGRSIGTQIVTLERISGGFVFRETTATPTGGQTTELVGTPVEVVRTSGGGL